MQMPFPFPYRSMFITFAVIQWLLVMQSHGSMSIFLESSLMIRTSPLSVLDIRYIVMLPISSAIRRHAVWISGLSDSLV